MRLQRVALASLLLACCSPKTPSAPAASDTPLTPPAPGSLVGDPSLPHLLSAASHSFNTPLGFERCRAVLVDVAALQQWGDSPGSMFNVELFDGNTVIAVSRGHVIGSPRAFSGYIKGEPYGDLLLSQPTAPDHPVLGWIQAVHLYPFDHHELVPNLAGGSLLCHGDSRKFLPI